MKKVIDKVQSLQKYVLKWWYCPLLFLFAAIDHYMVVFPILGMMVSSVFLAPKKWLSIALWSAAGSWLGAWILSWIAKTYGLSFIEFYFPVMVESSAWGFAESFFFRYGVWIVFLGGLAPIPQQPTVIIAALAGAPLLQIGVFLLLARLLKFGLLAYLASHAPQRLSRYRDVKVELEEMHVSPPGSTAKP